MTTSMFQDTMEPAGPGDRYAGFRKLWARVIQRAVYDWVEYRDSSKLEKRKIAESAETWLFKPSTLFNSFENVCDILGIDADQVRSRARRVTKDEVLKAEHVDRVSREQKNEVRIKSRQVGTVLALEA